jgi:Predicted membrane protein (DUF2079)
VGVYFVLSFLLSAVRFTGFRIQTWDIGIFEQSFWSLTHGHGLFNSANLEYKGVPSFLGIHPAFLMYPLGYLYALAPSVDTLFVVQSACVALAAVPLYFLTARLSGSKWKGLLCGGMFLLWAPTLVGNLFDFHLEAFLPVTMFTFVALWASRRYVLAVIPAALACAALEVGPIFIAAAGVFFVLESFSPSAQTPTTPPPGVDSRRPSYPRRLARVLRQPPALFGILCIVGGIIVYVALRYVEADWYGGAAVLAAGSTALPSLIDPLRYGVTGLSVDFGYAAKNFLAWLEYWVIVYALVAFIPLRAFRTLVVALPWIGYTLITDHTSYIILGNQYGFVAAVGVFIGFAYGVSSIQFASLRETARAWWEAGTSFASGAPAKPEWDETDSPEGRDIPSRTPGGGEGTLDAVPGGAVTGGVSPPAGAAAENLPTKLLAATMVEETSVAVSNPELTRKALEPKISLRRRPRPSASLWTAAILAAIALNVALTPFDPLLADTPLGAGYRLSYEVPAAFPAMAEVSRLIPSGASLLATSDLFSYVANNVNAYTTGESSAQGPPGDLPFNATNPPQYVLTSHTEYSLLPSWVGPMLWNASDYSPRAIMGDTPRGWIFLFEHNYTGPVLNLMLPPYPPSVDYYSTNGMTPGPVGAYQGSPTAFGGKGIIDSTGATGRVWTGPNAEIPSGRYTFTAFLRVWLLNPSTVPGPKAPLVRIWLSTMGGYASCPTTLNLTGFPTFAKYNASTYRSEPWTPVPFSPCISGGAGLPYFQPTAQFLGQLISPDVGVELNYVAVQTVPKG